MSTKVFEIGMQYLCDISRKKLEYLDFWYLHRPPINGNNLLHMLVKDNASDYFYE